MEFLTQARKWKMGGKWVENECKRGWKSSEDIFQQILP